MQTLLFTNWKEVFQKKKVDADRRTNITKNHTSTHILNASSRGVLGSWVWQHSAFKEDDHARLDITHHSSLTDSQVKQIEDPFISNGFSSKTNRRCCKQYGKAKLSSKY
jgi:alanyl-tRNA synthetase